MPNHHHPPRRCIYRWFFMVFLCFSWFLIVFHRFFKELDFKELEIHRYSLMDIHQWIFIDGYPTDIQWIFIDGYSFFGPIESFFNERRSLFQLNGQADRIQKAKKPSKKLQKTKIQETLHKSGLRLMFMGFW